MGSIIKGGVKFPTLVRMKIHVPDTRDTESIELRENAELRLFFTAENRIQNDMETKTQLFSKTPKAFYLSLPVKKREQ
jgi:hypothetical protein